MKVELERVLPADIEKRSFEIITEELGDRKLPEDKALLIKRVIPSPPEYTRVFAKPMVAAGVMGMAVWAAYGLVSRFMGNTLSTMAAICVGVVVYAVLVVALKAISREDLSLMPKGDKIARLLRL